MQCGDIIGLDSNQAANHSRKYKLHLCICVKENIFLFINTSGAHREGAMVITPKDWLVPLNHKSGFISCDKLIHYSASYLQKHKMSVKGRLTDAALTTLMDHINESELLTGEEIDIVIEALESYFFHKP